MNIQLKKIALAVLTFTFVISCDKDDVPVTTDSTATTGGLTLKFDNVVSTTKGLYDDLVLGSYSFTTSSGEVITVTDINYIISNIVLIKEDGKEVPYSKDSLFIINEKQAKEKIELSSIPVGKYSKVRFGVGVEKSFWEKGEAAQQTFWDKAKLDINKMTWSWTSGYKFVLFEGNFKSTVDTESKVFKVHLGGYTPNNNYREVTVNLPTVAEVKGGEKPSVHIYADVKHIIDGHEPIRFSEGTAIMNGEKLVKVAENLEHVFSVDHVHNH